MVVVIEEEQEQEEVVTLNDTNTEASFINNGDSDGFETASEGGSDGVSGGDDDGVVLPSELQRDDVNQPNTSVHSENDHNQKGDSYDHALDQDLDEKALAQANDAKVEGNELFKDGKYEDALLKYEAALEVAPEIPKPEPTPQVAPEIPKEESTSQASPDKSKHESSPQVAPELTAVVELRSICHFNRAVCFLKLGKYDETVKECSKALELNPVYVKALVRRGEAYEKLERYDEAISDMKKIMELDSSNSSNYQQARRNIARLEPLAREKMEKMKEEMIGKLKDMGNSILGRFGMSVDNFKAVQDPKTGSYSLSFQR